MGNCCGEAKDTESDIVDGDDGVSEDGEDESTGTDVVLHVYDLGDSTQLQKANRIMYALGSGVYHTGVEVYGTEWSYGNTQTKHTGIFSGKPAGCRAHHYRQGVYMGRTPLEQGEVKQLMKELRSEWPGNEYDIMRRNCTHFCNELCEALGVGPIPRWVTKLANVGQTVEDATRGATRITANVLLAPALAAGKALPWVHTDGRRLSLGLTQGSRSSLGSTQGRRSRTVSVASDGGPSRGDPRNGFADGFAYVGAAPPVPWISETRPLAALSSAPGFYSPALVVPPVA